VIFAHLWVWLTFCVGERDAMERGRRERKRPEKVGWGTVGRFIGDLERASQRVTQEETWGKCSAKWLLDCVI
jgi:hypothetical protein